MVQFIHKKCIGNLKVNYATNNKIQDRFTLKRLKKITSKTILQKNVGKQTDHNQSNVFMKSLFIRRYIIKIRPPLSHQGG